MRTRHLGLAVAVLLAGLGGRAVAQPVGTFRWQLRPFCNVVTVAITQNGPIYRLEGTDDQCGGADAASVTGTAFPNADGTIGFGLNIVTTPGGRPVHVDADISLGTFSGTWRDSAGGSGTFTLTPGAGTGGSPRPLPALPSSLPSTITLRQDGGVVAGGAQNVGAIPASGPGLRMMWYPAKAAFRAGEAVNNGWDDARIGYGSVALGNGPVASGFSSTAFGMDSAATGDVSTAMGNATLAAGTASTALGDHSLASGASSLAIGSETSATAIGAFAGGGVFTTASGPRSLAFGENVRAQGAGSVALGTRATAAADGSFAFGDQSSSSMFSVTQPNQFKVRAAGGVEFFSNPQANIGVRLVAGGVQWTSLSDVNTKHLFRDLDGEEILAKFAAMPVREWSYKAQDAAIRHIGPTAQDFHAAFGLGEEPLRIGTLDADGVALAGVKALEARTRELSEQLATLIDRLAQLERRLDKQ